MNSESKINPPNPEKKQMKKYILRNLYALVDGRERVFDAFEYEIFLLKIEIAGFSDSATRDKFSERFSFKILTPKQMLQRLPIALTQVKERKTPENLLNGIRQIIYFLYQAN